MARPDDEPADDQAPFDWDAWEKNRFTGANRLWLLLPLASMVMMTLLSFKSNGQLIPWGPP